MTSLTTPKLQLNPYNLKKVLVIGSGPIVIGQAAEFDYAGTQACKALREENIKVVLVNPNPATIMTDTNTAEAVYIEPLTVEVLEKIIALEKPDGLLGTLGGQNGLNLAVELDKAGILAKHGVKVLGTPIASIEMAEDRDLFRALLQRIGEPILAGAAVTSVDDALAAAEEVGYPVVVRPAYTLGGTGGGFAANPEKLRTLAGTGLAASRVGQVLIEQSLSGWKEIEYEVMRDSADNVITVCNMENLDPMGVHTGDSIVVAPSQTLSDKDYQLLRTASLNIIRSLRIEGGCNVQFAYQPHPWTGKSLEQGSPYYVIEVNPRVSRSSALASKSTGYPIARVATKIALGATLAQITNQVTKSTTAAFEPALDYCVVKIPSWPFSKFREADRKLGTQMKATGEAMAIERTFEAALQKAIRSLDGQRTSLLWEDTAWQQEWQSNSEAWLEADDLRLWKIASALRNNFTPKEISQKSGVDPWFLYAIQRIVEKQRQLQGVNSISRGLLLSSKKMGFSDAQIASLRGEPELQIRDQRLEHKLIPVYKMVDTCAGQFEAITPYFYSCYSDENEATGLSGTRTIVLGSGPIRIGQGIEFDYSSVHAANSMTNKTKSIMINTNPETVSTDFDASDRLYFEPLDNESVLDIIENEQKFGTGPIHIFTQFGGQTAINLSQSLTKARVGHLVQGSTAEAIDRVTDRGRFIEFAANINLPLPKGGTARTLEDAYQIASSVGYPVLVRPSYVLGGRAMQIVETEQELEQVFANVLTVVPKQNEAGDKYDEYVQNALAAVGQQIKLVDKYGEYMQNTVLIDHYFNGIEVEIDAVSDGTDVVIPGIMEHVERAGIHSGDSISVYPAKSLTETEVKTLVDYTLQIARTLEVKGLMNIQFVVAPHQPSNGELKESGQPGVPQPAPRPIYVIEVNPRSSRTVPFISKVTGVPLVAIASKVMLGETIREQNWSSGLVDKSGVFAVKAPVFSMSKLTGADTLLGPEMKSTGEVMGIDKTPEAAMAKALLASGSSIPSSTPVLLSFADKDKAEAATLIDLLAQRNHPFYATQGTAGLIRSRDVEVTIVERIISGNYPNALHLIQQKKVGAVVNTLTGELSTLQDGFTIRRAAVEANIPCFTSIDTAIAAVRAEDTKTYNVSSLQHYIQQGKKGRTVNRHSTK